MFLFCMRRNDEINFASGNNTENCVFKDVGSLVKTKIMKLLPRITDFYKNQQQSVLRKDQVDYGCVMFTFITLTFLGTWIVIP